MSFRNETELKQYTGFDRAFVMPFDRELNNGEVLVTVDDVSQVNGAELVIDPTPTIVNDSTNIDGISIIADQAVQVQIATGTATVGNTYRVKFIATSDAGNTIPLVGRITII